jgi:ABC-type multidrug transport system fused ATPase/permease subunit
MIAVSIVLTSAERILWSLAYLAWLDESRATWGLATIAIGMGVLRAFVRSEALRYVRSTLGLALVVSPLREPGRWASEESKVEAAVFEGRAAAEQLLLSSIPSLLANVAAIAGVLFALGNFDSRALTGVLLIVLSFLAFGLVRRTTFRWLDAVWQKYLQVCLGMLTAFHASTEISASGQAEAYGSQMKTKVEEWTSAAASTERSVAVLERVPVVIMALCVLALATTFHRPEASALLKLASIAPMTLAALRSAQDIVRIGPKMATLAPFLETREQELGKARPLPSFPIVIEFKQVSFSYASSSYLPLIRALSFRCKAGEVIGVRGPNGSGKSTLLKLVLGLEVPSGGTIALSDSALQAVNLDGWRQSVSYLPQRPYLPERFTVREVFRLTIPDISDEDAIASLRLTEVWEKLASSASGDPLGTPLGTLSVGERQRVALARAFARSAPVILLDEPDENLDARGVDVLRRLILARRSDGLIVVSAHNREILDVADAIVDLPA